MASHPSKIVAVDVLIENPEALINNRADSLSITAGYIIISGMEACPDESERSYRTRGSHVMKSHNHLSA